MPYPPYITAVQKATAREMSKVADQMGADFVLALGDNFYYKGVDRGKTSICLTVEVILLPSFKRLVYTLISKANDKHCWGVTSYT